VPLEAQNKKATIIAEAILGRGKFIKDPSMHKSEYLEFRTAKRFLQVEKETPWLARREGVRTPLRSVHPNYFFTDRNP
jgi:hypothetical protein